MTGKTRPNRRFFKYLRRLLLLLLLVVCLLLAVAVWLFHNINDYKDDIAEQLSHEFGYPVTLKALHGHWSGGIPRLVASDVTIQRPGHPIQLAKVNIGLSVLGTLQSQVLDVQQVDIHELRINIEPQLAAAITAMRSPSTSADLSLDAMRAELSEILTAVPEGIEVLFTNTVLQWEQQSVAVNARFWTDNDVKRLVVTTEYAPQALVAAVDIRISDWRDAETLQLSAKVEHNNAPIIWLEQLTASILRPSVGPALGAAAGTDEGSAAKISCESPYWFSTNWSVVVSQSGVTGDGQLTLSDKRTSVEQRLAPLHLKTAYQLNDAGVSATLRHAPIQHAPVLSVVDGFKVTERAGRWQLQADTVYLPSLTQRVVSWCRQDSPINQWLSTTQPTGQLQAVTVGLEASGAWQVAATAANVSVKPTKTTPGVRNISGQLVATPDELALQMNSKQFAFQWDKYLRSTLRFDYLRGPISVFPSQGWRVQSGELQLANADVKGRVTWGLDPEENYQLDVDAELDHINIAGVPKLLPATMGKGGLQWCDQGLLGGTGTGKLSIHGPALAIPFYDKEGTFDIELNGKDGVVKFSPEWATLKAGKLQFNLRNARIDVKASKASTKKIRTDDVRVAIPDFRQPFINVDLTAKGQASDVIRYVADTPLAEKIPFDLTELAAKGEVKIGLGLVVNVDDVNETKATGRVYLKDNQIALPAQNQMFSGLSGEVSFTEEDYAAKGVRFNYKGFPVKVSLARGEQGIEATLTGTIRSYVDRAGGEREALLGYMSPSVLQYLNGRTHWRVDVKQTQYGLDRQFYYNLTPMALLLPEPFGKPTGERAEIKASQIMGPNGSSLIKARYIRNGQVQLRAQGLAISDDFAKMSALRLGVMVGGGAATVPAKEGVTVSGKLSVLRLKELLSVVDSIRQPLSSGTPSVTASSQTEQVDEGTEPNLLQLNTVDLHIGRFHFGGVALQNIQTHVDHGKHHWLLSLSSPDMEGSISIPKAFDALSVLDIDFSEFKLDPFFPKGGEQTATPVVAATSSGSNEAASLPQHLPAIRLNVAKLSVNNLQLGTLKAETKPDWKGLSLQNVSLKGSALQASAKGGWRFVDGKHYSELVLDLKSRDINHLLSALGFAKQLRAKSSHFNFNTHWQGTLADFSLATMRGKATLNIKEGELLAVDPGAGKILSLLSFVNLPRRLMLDFSDLTAKGLLFDRIKGTFSIGDGNIFTTDSRIESSTADVKIVGRIGVTKQDFDQYITVYPKVSSALSVLGGLVGGLEVGAVFLILQPILGITMDDLTAQYFVVKGPWDKPVFMTPDGKPITAKKPKDSVKFPPARGPRRR